MLARPFTSSNVALTTAVTGWHAALAEKTRPDKGSFGLRLKQVQTKLLSRLAIHRQAQGVLK